MTNFKNCNNKVILIKEAVPSASTFTLNCEVPGQNCLVENNSKGIQVDSISIHKITDLQYQNKTLLLKLKRLNEKYSKSLEKIKQLEEKLNKQSTKLNLTNNIFEDAETSDSTAVFLVDLIKNYNKKTLRWSEISVRMCTVWRFSSPKGYEHCRKHIIKLPSKATLSRYLGEYSGTNELCRQHLLAEVSLLKVPVERVCSLIIDDMSIKAKIHYSRAEDQIYGLDTAKSTTIGERPQVANKMLCYVIHGLSMKYTLPAGYFFHATLTTAQFTSLTLKILKLLTDCGFIVLRVVTDNHSSNVALFKNLSGGTPKNYIDHPFLTHIPLFLSFDYCHIIKNARNLFLERKMYSSAGVISATFLRELHNFQKRLPVKPVKYLTSKHLYPTNFDKMNVLRAVQIFSPPVTASLKFLMEAGNEEFQNLTGTISYMENMYHFFQVHNISNRTHYIRSLDSNVAPYVDVTDERLHWLDVTLPNYVDDIQRSSANAGIEGLSKETAHALQFTAKSTTLCVKFLLQQVGFYYVLTRSFSSDAVEAMFSHVRLKGGSNDTTDTRAAEYALRQILRCGIVKASTSSNIAGNIDYTSSAKFTPSVNITEQEDKEELPLPSGLKLQIQNLSLQILPDDSIYSASVAFLAGYIIKKIDETFHCNTCLEPLLSVVIPGPLMKLIILQDRGNLNYPSNKFVGIIKQLTDVIPEILPFLQYTKTCTQLSKILCPVLQQNAIFACVDHRSHICDVVVNSVVKPVLDNICREQTDSLTKKCLKCKPTSRKILKL